jgi:hypothetical protein
MPLTPKGLEIYQTLTDERKRIIEKKLAINAALSKTYLEYDLNKNNATIFTRLPITSSLQEDTFLEALAGISFSATIIWNTIGLEISEKGEITPPPPAFDKEVPPPTKA